MKQIRSTMLHLGAAALLAAARIRPATAGEGRPLPEQALLDSAGLVVDNAALVQQGRWFLLVLDPGMASSQSLLGVLARKADGYDGRLVVVVAGAQEPAQAFIAANQKLQGVRWLLDPEGGAGAALRLSATPVLLAMDASNQIGWQLAGQPKRGAVEAMVARWLGITPAQGQ